MEPETELSFGTRVKLMRVRRGLSQTDLAAKTGLSANQISNWELDYSMPTCRYIPALCRGLGCSADYLFGLEQETLTEDEQYCLDHYRRLDDAGRHTVRAVLDSQLELQRLADV